MAINRKGVSRLSLYMAMFAIILSITVDVVLTNNVEEVKRAQARHNLEQYVYCVEAMDASSGLDDRSILSICGRKLRTSITGDTYVLDATTLEFVVENSTDVPAEKLYFTEESIGGLFADWKSGQRAVRQFVSGNDSEAGMNVWYNFDGHTEWSEWKSVLMFGSGKEYVLVQGVQKDEVMKLFIGSRFALFFGTLIFVLYFMTTGIVDSRKNRRHCDS